MNDNPFFFNGSFPPSSPTPPAPFLADLYRHLPFLVVHLTMDGIILNANPEAERLTGYSEEYLVGRNFWATLFPGKLFAQVPKFISANTPTPLLRDMPMTLRTRTGGDRTIAFTRFIHAPLLPGVDPADTGLKTLVCIGVDLTDRLLEADKTAAMNTMDMKSPESDTETPKQPEDNSEAHDFGATVGNGGTVDGEFVTPLAIGSPSPLPSSALTAGGAGPPPNTESVRQVHEFLTQIDARMSALRSAVEKGRREDLALLAEQLHTGARECGLLEFSAKAQRLQAAATQSGVEPLNAILGEILAMYRWPSGDAQ